MTIVYTVVLQTSKGWRVELETRDYDAAQAKFNTLRQNPSAGDQEIAILANGEMDTFAKLAPQATPDC